ncbi:MAG: helix-turn-helix domain-containing protein [Candidatus Eisenbacteria bacterium]|nr:helix-turn-helix domain-containing protein [Candidatus Eisenbacteria bacterium]
MPIPDRQHRVLTRYVAAFLVCVSLPVLSLGFVFYRNASFILLKELEGHIAGEMARLSQVFDNMMSELYQTAFRASYDQGLSWYYVERNDYTRVNVVRKLREYKRDYVDYVLLSRPGDRAILTNVGSMSLPTVRKSVFSAPEPAADESDTQYFDLLAEAQTPEVLSIGVSLSAEDSRDAHLMYAYPLLNRHPAGILSFVMSEDSLKQLVGGILGKLNGAIAVLDRNDRPLFVFQERMAFLGLPPGAASDPGGVARVTSLKLGGQHVSCVDVRSEESGLRYVAILSLEDYMQEVIRTKRYVLASVMGVLLVSALVGIGMALRIYKPIERLTAYAATSYKGTKIRRSADELNYISSVLTETMDANEHLNRRLVTQLTLVQELALLKVVRGQITRRDDVDAMLSANDIRLPGPDVGAVVVSIEGERDGRDMDSLLPLLRGSLDTAPGLCAYYCLGLDRRQAVLVINAARDDGRHLLMEGIARICTSTLTERAGAEADIGVGRFYGDRLLLNKSFLEALAALEYRQLKGHARTVYYADIDFEEGATDWYPVEQQGMLRQCLKQGNLPACIDVVSDMIRLTDQKGLSLDSLRCVCFDIVNSTMKSLKEHGITPDGDCVHDLSRFESLEDLKHKLVRLATRVCDHISESNGSESSRMRFLRAGVMEYLDKNYGDSRLNLDMVADQFGISAKRLSNIFRQLTDSRFVDYLRELRVSRAKSFLASGRTVAEISREVGFANPARLIRSFKAVEGMTPGQFRDRACSRLVVAAHPADGEKSARNGNY